MANCLVMENEFQKKQKPVLDLKIAKQKIEHFCAYQERCHQEVEKKLKSYGLIPLAIDHLMEQLIDEDFLDEERFARAYARGSFRHKKWGWKKIELELKKRNISTYCREKAYSEIDLDEYRLLLSSVLEKKEVKGHSRYQKEQKLIKYAMSRGFEYELTRSVLDDLFG